MGRLAAACVGCLLVLSFGAAPAAAQQAEIAPSDTLNVLTLEGGSTLYGRIVGVQGDQIVFETTSGNRIEVDRSQIRSLEPVHGTMVDGEVWTEDRNTTRLFFAPTGRALAPGEGYVGVHELFFSVAAFGVGDRFVLAGGTPILPGLIGDVLYVAPKAVIIQTPGVSIAAGALGFFATDEIDPGSFGVVYGAATLGDEHSAFTGAFGWAYEWSGDNAELSNEPVLMIGGEHRVGASTKLLTENYLFPGAEEVGVSGGVRLLGERFSADLGLAMLLGADSPCCLPLVSVTYGF